MGCRGVGDRNGGLRRRGKRRRCCQPRPPPRHPCADGIRHPPAVLPWLLPCLNSSVGSFTGTTGDEETAVCCLPTKNSTKVLRTLATGHSRSPLFWPADAIMSLRCPRCWVKESTER